MTQVTNWEQLYFKEVANHTETLAAKNRLADKIWGLEIDVQEADYNYKTLMLFNKDWIKKAEALEIENRRLRSYTFYGICCRIIKWFRIASVINKSHK